MSALFDVTSAFGRYGVKVEAGLFQSTLADIIRNRRSGDHAVILADRYFEPILAVLNIPVIFLSADETVKSLDAIPDVVVKLRKFGANRKTSLFAIGGGIIQDVAAFIANIFMRGIPWTYLPTTFLGMTDSCIGGKSSINVGEHKNLVGTYGPPTEVLIDPELTRTLSPSQVAEGTIEAAKICYCRGSVAFSEYLTLTSMPGDPTARLEKTLCASLAAKKWFIESDEFDQKERLLLNFGHTFGHALEGASHFDVSHGFAVGFGILCAIEMAHLLERSDSTGATDLLRTHILDLLAIAPRLGDIIRAVETNDVLDRFRSDKKHGVDDYAVIVPRAGGGVELIRLRRDETTTGLIVAALTKAREELLA